MKVVSKLTLTSIAALVGSAVLYGCGSGGSGDVAVAPTVPVVAVTAVPVAAANSPFIGVTMRVTCANGTTGTGSVGTTALPGEGSISVTGTCTPPIRIEAISAGKMRPLGAPSDGSGDVTYDPAVNLPVSTVLATIPTTAAPVDTVTALVANQVTSLSSETATTLTTKKGLVATSLGISTAAMDTDYRNADHAAAGAKLGQIASLAARNLATAGLPATVSSTKSLGQLIADGMTTEAAKGAALTTAALYTAAAGTGAAAPAAGDLTNIDNDAGRVNNMVVNFTASATSLGKVNDLIAVANTAAKSATTPTAAQTALIADINARAQKTAIDAIGAQAAKMVTDVATTSGISTNAIAIARSAASGIVANALTQIGQGGNAADLAAQAKASAEIVKTAIQNDAKATTKVFAAPPTVGNSNAAAALVAQAQTAVGSLKATTTTFDPTTAGANALTVATAIKDVAPPASTATGQQEAFQAAIGAVAAKIDPAKIVLTDSATKTNLTTTVGTLQTQLVTAIGTPTADGSSVSLGITGAAALLGANQLNFQTPPTITGTVALGTTTTTSSTSSTSKATTTTTTTTTTAAPTTTTAAPTTTTTAAPTTTTTAAPTTTTTAAPTTTTAVVVVTTTTATPTTTTTVATTTTTTVAATALNATVASTTTAPLDAKSGLGTLVGTAANPTGVAYTGAPVSFGPFAISGLTAASTVAPAGILSTTYVTVQVNSAAATTSAAINNGDRLVVSFDLKTCLANGDCTTFGTSSFPQISIGTVRQVFSLTLCSSPALPPSQGNTQCK